jgi:hypothetical protein
VNFNGFAQRELMSETVSVLRRVPPVAWQILTWFMIVLLATSTAIRFGKYRRWKWRWNPRPSARVSQSVVRHHYDRMLNIVARHGLRKEEPDTPFEFQTAVQRDAASISEEVATVTDSFCKTFYGEKALSKSELAATEQALKRLKDRCAR